MTFITAHLGWHGSTNLPALH